VRPRVPRTLRVLWWGWKAEFSGAAEYRADLFSGTIVSAAWLAISVMPMLVVSAQAPPTAGWTLPRLLFLSAVWYLMDAILWMLIMTNCRRWSFAVQNGTLDALLLRPVSSLVLCSLGSIYVQDLPKVALAIGLGTGAVIAGGGPSSAVACLAAVAAIGCACCLMWAAGVLANYKALSQVQFDGMFVVTAMHSLARVPTPLYGPTLRLVLTAVIPVAFLATVPTQIFYGAAGLWMALVAVALSAGVVMLTSRLWRRELRHYTGAMG